MLAFAASFMTQVIFIELQHFESLLLEIKEDNDKEIAEAVEKALHAKLPKLQAKLNKAIEERTFLREVNSILVIHVDF